MNGEQERIWKEAVVSYFRAVSRYSYLRLGKSWKTSVGLTL
jgi:hypothetical protein